MEESDSFPLLGSWAQPPKEVTPLTGILTLRILLCFTCVTQDKLYYHTTA